MSILEKASSPEVLNHSWKKLHNDKTIWQQGISRWEMEKNFVYHITKLGKEIREGTYQPDPVRFFPVNKGDGKSRIISAYCLRDKMAQRALLTVLEPIGEKYFHYDSFGYRPGRSIDMALSRVKEYISCGMKWVIDADIQSYFDTIPHKPLLKSVKILIKDRNTTKMIKKWLDAGTVKRGFVASSKGIPSGAVISPFLCNVYLTKWDLEMSRNNLPFVRFADDFLVFAKSKRSAENAYSYVDQALKKMGLSLNIQKTQVVTCGPNVKFLGRPLPGKNVRRKWR
ncbi:Retron-type reverse transcriptase [Candidatus Magnetomorum sp. HK-1]|nr:Retron-type reverse transcriptase [Candidatus Magnetomorum sp. HK-1]